MDKRHVRDALKDRLAIGGRGYRLTLRLTARNSLQMPEARNTATQFSLQVKDREVDVGVVVGAANLLKVELVPLKQVSPIKDAVDRQLPSSGQVQYCQQHALLDLIQSPSACNKHDAAQVNTNFERSVPDLHAVRQRTITHKNYEPVLRLVTPLLMPKSSHLYGISLDPVAFTVAGAQQGL